MTKASKQDNDDDEEVEEEETQSKMEDVRMSNFAYAQTNVGEALTLFFGIIGISSAIVASEMSVTRELREENEKDVFSILYILTASNLLMILSIMGNY